MPTWSASNPVWTDDNFTVKHLAFLPILPYLVTQYSAVYTQMKNFIEICSQLIQEELIFYVDKKVYSVGKEIQIMQPVEFICLVFCFGTFHTVKSLLK